MSTRATHPSKARGSAGAASTSIPIDRVAGHDDHTRALRWRDRGDPTVRDELVRRFMPLARRLAGNWAGPGDPLEDLVAVATAGLLDALERHDPRYDVSLEAFAVLTILGALKRHTAGLVTHVPRGAAALLASQP
jgi:RNA polymerase sigma-B factor